MADKIRDENAATSKNNNSHVLLQNGLETTRSYLRKIVEQEAGGMVKAKEGISDIVQETLLEAYRDIGQFRGTTATELRAWLRRILLHNINRAASYYRRYKRQASREVPGMFGPAAALNQFVADTTSPSAGAIREELAAVVGDVLDQLPDRDRELLIWRNEGCTFGEMGRRAGYSAPAAHKNWLKALERARQKLAPLADP